jgi:hypothetical protein
MLSETNYVLLAWWRGKVLVRRHPIVSEKTNTMQSIGKVITNKNFFGKQNGQRLLSMWFLYFLIVSQWGHVWAARMLSTYSLLVCLVHTWYQMLISNKSCSQRAKRTTFEHYCMTTHNMFWEQVSILPTAGCSLTKTRSPTDHDLGDTTPELATVNLVPCITAG